MRKPEASRVEARESESRVSNRYYNVALLSDFQVMIKANTTFDQ